MDFLIFHLFLDSCVGSLLKWGFLVTKLEFYFTVCQVVQYKILLLFHIWDWPEPKLVLFWGGECYFYSVLVASSGRTGSILAGGTEQSAAVQILWAFGLIVDFALKPSPHLKKKSERKPNNQLHLLLFKKKNCCLVSCNFTFVTRGCVYFQLWQFCLMNQLVLNSQGEVPFPALHLFAKCVCSLNSWWWLQLKRAISKRVFSLISQSSVWLLAGIFPLWFHRGCLPKHHTCDSRESVCLFVV